MRNKDSKSYLRESLNVPFNNEHLIADFVAQLSFLLKHYFKYEESMKILVYHLFFNLNRRNFKYRPDSNTIKIRKFLRISDFEKASENFEN